MYHASQGGTGAGAELLRDILYTWVIGTFQVPDREAQLRSETIKRWASASPSEIFEYVSKSSKNSTLHDIIRNFVTGIVGNHVHMQWAMCTPAAFPIGGAIWSMLGKIVGSGRARTERGDDFGRLPANFVRTVFRIPLISAKRLKRYFLQLSASERTTITSIAIRRKMNTCVQIRRLCSDDSQDHLKTVLVPYCNGCCTVRWGKRRSEVRLKLSRGGESQIVCMCGSSDINVFTLRGFVVTCGLQITRLCSSCGIIICNDEIFYVGERGFCKKCSVAVYPTGCLVCDLPATYIGVAGHTSAYGLCTSHTAPFHYSSSLEDIKAVLIKRSQV